LNRIDDDPPEEPQSQPQPTVLPSTVTNITGLTPFDEESSSQSEPFSSREGTSLEIETTSSTSTARTLPAIAESTDIHDEDERPTAENDQSSQQVQRKRLISY
jgi:hypothetical protein